MKLQLCSLELWRSLAHPSPAPALLPLPCQLEYPPPPLDGRGGEKGRRRGRIRPGRLVRPGNARGFK